MIGSKTIAVVVPTYNEEIKIAKTLQTMPDYVDRIYVVDDSSTDQTAQIVEQLARQDARILSIRHTVNGGVGKAIATGYLAAANDSVDFVAVMAGDGQMDPKDLPDLLAPALADKADYVKGNRFFHEVQGVGEIPAVRLIGNLVLSILTKIASGYWHISDTQCGYTVINLTALRSIDWNLIYPRYGCPNDILTRLNIENFRVCEVPIHARYGSDWTSKMRVRKVIAPILSLLFRLFMLRMYRKYVYMNGHPIVLAYFAAFVLASVAFMLAAYLVVKTAIALVVPKAALIMFGIAMTGFIQVLLTAFSWDYQLNERLYAYQNSSQPR